MGSADIKTRPWCVFCGLNISKPTYPEERKLGEFSVGRCQCGAVYASDPTGFNIGSAMVECLVYACNDNWDLAWELLPEEDYLTGILEHYDEQTNQVVEKKQLDGRKIKGIIYFVRLHKDVDELVKRLKSSEGKHRAVSAFKASQSGTGISEKLPKLDPKRKKKKATKLKVKELVEAGDIDGLVELGFDDKKTMHFMQRLLFEPDEAKRWRIAHLIGEVCGRLSLRKPGMVSALLHRLFEACSDSAAANWGALETIGSIIAARPDMLGPFTRHILNYGGDGSMRVQVIWALGTIAKERPDLIRATSFYKLFGLLNSPDHLLRGHMLRLLGRIGAREMKSQIEKMQNEIEPVIIFEQGLPVKTDIGKLAKEALDLIGEKGEQNIE